MSWKDLFKKNETLISIDIGASAVKLLELDLTDPDSPSILNIGVAPLSGDIFSNNMITKTEKVAEQISSLIEANSIADKRAVVALPGPSVFTKKIKMPKVSLNELQSSIYFEASNFIPHNIDAVKLDYHILGESGKNQLDVLVVAVKNEIIDSFIDTLSLAGLEAAVVDVDYFALQNMFELCYPEHFDKTTALINVGSRYSSINICRRGESLFTGDIGVGGKLFSDAIAEAIGVTPEEAEKLKRTADSSVAEYDTIQEAIDKKVEYVASEFNRQLSFFWNASGSDEGIDSIMLTGGSSLIPRLAEDLAEKTGLECGTIDCFRRLKYGEGFDPEYLKQLSPIMSINVGMGIRQPGDKVIPDLD